jgi:hypothetical protein
MNTEITALLISKTLFITLLVALLPLCAITYYQYRLKLRRLEVERILNILNIVSEYREMHSHDISRLNFSISVMFAMMFSAIGLSVLFLSDELGFATRPSLILGGSMLKTADCGAQSSCFFYQSGALLVYGLGFMGAYIWGLQGILRRYALNDLLPMTFYKFGLRMITASILSLLLYHAVGGFEREFTARADTEGQSQVLPMTGNGLLMIAAFFIGMFPQRGIKWLSSRVSFLLVEKHPTVRMLPLEMIEGITAHDKQRLEELGIDTCYDLATADFIPLILKSPYSSRELIDWMLQAKLCVRFGDSVSELREHGIRIITELENLDDEFLEQLAKETSLRLSSLQRAARATKADPNIRRLQLAAEALGHYWEGAPEEPVSAPPKPASPHFSPDEQSSLDP